MSEANVFIPMADGVRLAATLYLPEVGGPWPALLEASPYRKDDVSVWPDVYRRLRDEAGYAVCRLDTRGTGTSEGVAVDEYPPGEAEDVCAVIAWLAGRPWCTGAVGMFGSSYAGFATLHAAILAPPALRAIVPMYATDDRYTDDIHYGGGIRKAAELNYPLSMVAHRDVERVANVDRVVEQDRGAVVCHNLVDHPPLAVRPRGGQRLRRDGAAQGPAGALGIQVLRLAGILEDEGHGRPMVSQRPRRSGPGTA